MNMPSRPPIRRTLAATVFAVLAAVPAGTAAQEGGSIEIPESLRIEHEEIRQQLTAVMRAPGEVGTAAGELARVLGPHFQRENQIALPPLGALRPLAHGEPVPGADRILAMTDSLRAELPEMLEEHETIAAAARNLVETAESHGHEAAAELGRTIQLHARTEEEVLYPAAVLVGGLIRARNP